MKTTIKTICTAFAAAIIATAHATAPTSATQFTPKMMNYQGYLANPSTGNAYKDGIYRIECRLYRQQSGGTAIWGARYSVYVKGGYFNIMLGDSSGANLGYTYSNTDLWRALWDDTAASERNRLWLGVKPLENYNNITDSSLAEIAPRQELLTAPYAFRSQSAYYANASFGNFNVNGNLTVTGSLSFPSSYSLKWISADSGNNKLTLGGTAQSSTSNPSIYNYAKYLYNYSYYDMSFAPYSGNITFTVPNNKSLQVKNNNFAVTNATTSMKSSAATTIEAGTKLSLLGSSVYGKGKVYWRTQGTGTDSAPVKIAQYVVEVPAGGKSGAVIFANDDDYDWVLVGYDTLNYSTQSGVAPIGIYVKKHDDNKWYVQVAFDTSLNSTRNVLCYVMGINKRFCMDSR